MGNLFGVNEEDAQPVKRESERRCDLKCNHLMLLFQNVQVLHTGLLAGYWQLVLSLRTFLSIIRNRSQ